MPSGEQIEAADYFFRNGYDPISEEVVGLDSVEEAIGGMLRPLIQILQASSLCIPPMVLQSRALYMFKIRTFETLSIFFAFIVLYAHSI